MGSQERLYHDQGILHGCPKATNGSPKTIVDPLQTKRFGKDQLEIHRYHLQIRSRSIPDHQGKTKVYGTTQEGKARFRRNRKLKSSFRLKKSICSIIPSFVRIFKKNNFRVTLS